MNLDIDVNNSVLEKRISVVRDVGWILLIQSAGFFVALIFGLIIYYKLVPNYPCWDNIDFLCHILFSLGVVTFPITVFWGSYKYMDVDFVPIIFRLYAASLWLSVPIILLLGRFSDRLSFILFCVLPIYIIAPQIFIWRYMKKITTIKTNNNTK
ncbi:MAG: hypothetical protein LBP59_09170 [Planctomycetaceae bacterium]|jgi:hypothetical protein|nr:hypothetical protein [Planctomycetaceae bacterium]